MARLHPFSSLVNFLYGGNSQDQSELRCEFRRQKLARTIWKEAVRKSMCLFTVRLIYFLIQEQRTPQNSGNY